MKFFTRLNKPCDSGNAETILFRPQEREAINEKPKWPANQEQASATLSRLFHGKLTPLLLLSSFRSANGNENEPPVYERRKSLALALRRARYRAMVLPDRGPHGERESISTVF